MSLDVWDAFAAAFASGVQGLQVGPHDLINAPFNSTRRRSPRHPCCHTLQVVSVVGQPATMTLVQQVLPAAAPATSQALSSDMSKPLATSVDNGLAAQAAPAVKQEAAMVLQDHVQHLAVQVSCQRGVW